MNVNITKEGNNYRVVLSGRLDTTNAEAFQSDIAPLMTGDVDNLDIDCTDMEYTSSLGLRMLLLLQKSVNVRKGKMVLRNMQPQVREVFDITGFSNIMHIE